MTAVECVKAGQPLVAPDFYCPQCLETPVPLGDSALSISGGVVQCRHARICLTELVTTPTASRLRNESVDGIAAGVEALRIEYALQTRCLGRHTGALCGACEEGYGETAGKCLKCRARWQHSMLFAAAALAFFCVYANCVRLAITYAQSPHQKSKYVTMSSLKILIYFCIRRRYWHPTSSTGGATMRFIFDPAPSAQAAMPRRLHCQSASACPCTQR